MGIKNKIFFRWSRDNQERFADEVEAALDSKANKKDVDDALALMSDKEDTPCDTSDKVSKNGDTMTGRLRLKGEARTNAPLSLVSDNNSEILIFPQSNATNMLIEKTSSGTFSLGWSGSFAASFTALNFGSVATSLGTSTYKWGTTYTTKLNNGADIVIPNKAGTLALLSDIPNLPDAPDETRVLKTGDTMTGPLKILLNGSPNRAGLVMSGNSDGSRSVGLVSHFEGNTFDIQFVGTTRFSMTPTMFYPASNNTATLGFSSLKWANIFAMKLNNGADIEIPNKAGTFALLSDIEDILRQHGLID